MKQDKKFTFLLEKFSGINSAYAGSLQRTDSLEYR